MKAEDIYARLQEKFADSVTELVTENPDPYIVIDKAKVAEVGQFLKDTSALGFDFLESISGVDTGEHLWCVYHLFSYTHRHAVVIKLKLDYDDTVIPSCCEVWNAANWHEREQYDLFGFTFTGHPDLRRILLPEDWAGHPLLKSYEYPEEYHEIDHYRPDPKEQFKALDELAAKAAEKVKEQQAQKAGADDAPSQSETPA